MYNIYPDKYLYYMKLLKTIKKLIKEAEDRYYQADPTSLSVEELDRLEKNYKDSLKLLRIYQGKEKGRNN